MYKENFNKSRKIPEMIIKFSKVAVSKVNIRINLLFVYTSNEKLERKLKIITYDSIKYMKHLEMNLQKCM